MPFAEEPADGFEAFVAGAKRAARSAGGACVRLPYWPAFRRTGASVPLPGGVERIYCYHVRKTGGTALAHAFLTLGQEDADRVERRMRYPPFRTSSGPYRYVYQARPLLRRGHYFFGYGHRPAEHLRLPDRTFTVTILRDPVERAVSLYRYLADPRADDGQTFRALADERDWARSGFGSFLDRVSRPQLLNQLYMFSVSGSVPEAAERILGCDRVLSTEALDRGVGELAAFLGLPLALRRVRQSRFGYSPTDSETARLRELLEPEYQLLALLARLAAAHSGAGQPSRPGSPGSPASGKAV
jgi:hypothetical protein